MNSRAAPVNVSSSTEAPGTKSRPQPPWKPSCSFPPHGHHPNSGGQGRNLVVCIDGTSNQFGAKNTNVIELYYLLKKDKTQVTYYDSGVGTYAQPSWKSFSYWRQVFENKMDLAIAWNLEKIILDAYRWLSATYEEGDVIYLFGFSRGAYQSRALSAMIDKVGIIHKGNEAQIPFAYELYADPSTSYEKKDENGQDIPGTSRAARFKQTFSRDVRVHFVGAWDTVSSVGFVRGKTLPGTTDGMVHVCHFRHALALDERRVKFLPEFAYGGVAKPPESKKPADDAAEAKDPRAARSRDLSTAPKGDIKEVWFAGTHSDIGGGIVDNENLDRSGPPLSWMLGEAISCGLLVNAEAGKSQRWKWKNKDGPHESLTGVWWLLEYLPITIPSYRGPQSTMRRFHRGKGRHVLHGQQLHGSLSFEKGYVPKATARGSDGKHLDWEALFCDRGDWLEKDLLGAALALASDIEGSMSAEGGRTKVDVKNVEKFIEGFKSPGGLWTIEQVSDVVKLIEKILLWVGNNEEFETLRDQLFGVFLDAGGKVTSREIFDLLLPVAISRESDHRFNARAALGSFAHKNTLACHDIYGPNGDKLGQAEIGTLCETGEYALVYAANPFNYISFSPDGKYILSSSDDQTVQLWDVTTGRCIKQMSGHTDSVRTVVMSPDAKLIASASWDDIVRIWDAETGETLKELEGNLAGFSSAVFSPDGEHVVSGSWDNSVQIWDISTGDCTKELTGHTEPVLTAAVSPDGKLIVSGSQDKTIRVWNMETGEGVGEPLQGHTDSIGSLVFSPDSRHIVCGSSDYSISLWETTTATCIKRMTGHTDKVHSVAVSPNSKLIASGSLDNTIRIWDLETGMAIGNPLRGHTNLVLSVTFSPDGEYIISASEDGTIRTWRLGAFGIATSNL